jgi:hypothetical protein
MLSLSPARLKDILKGKFGSVGKNETPNRKIGVTYPAGAVRAVFSLNDRSVDFSN